MQFLDDFLEEFLEFVESKVENGQWLSLLFWVFVAARIVTCAERNIRKEMVRFFKILSGKFRTNSPTWNSRLYLQKSSK